MIRLVVVGCLVARVAAAGPPCGSGTPSMIELDAAVADPQAIVFVGKIAAVHVPPRSGFDGQVGTIDVDVQTMLRGAAVKRVVVPGASEKCIPKAACLPTVWDLAKPGTKVIVGCIANRVAITAADAPAVDDAKRCLALGTGGSAALATAYVDGKQLARACVARIACDEHHRSDAIAGLVAAMLAPKLAAEAKLDLGLVLVQSVSAAQSIIGCTTPPPKLFRADLGGGDAANQAIARGLLEGMLAAADKNHRHRFANLVWDMFVEWYEKQPQWKLLVAKLGPLAPRAAKQLRSLGGPDAEHYESIAATIDAANKP